MARYLYACADGRPCYYLDEDGGDVMGYSLNGQWAFYLDRDRRNAYAPNGQPLFYIDGCYFCDGNGAVLYSDEETRLTDAQWRIVDRVGASVHPNFRPAYKQRVIALLRGSKIDDAAVRRAAERAQAEFGE